MVGTQWTSPLCRGESLKAAPSQASCSPISATETETPQASTVSWGLLSQALSKVPSGSLPEYGLES